MEDHKKHNKKKTGGKANKKQKDGDKPINPKAFSIQSANKAAKRFHRSQDHKQKKIHIPLPVRDVAEPPPVVVAVVGPPRVGKTTLIKAIIKNFTRQRIANIRGPVTVVSGKHRRLSIVECDSSLNNMVDLAKVADLAILMIDANFGFEMEIFEFLAICQVHGFPKVMGVLNHLDTFTDTTKMRKTKKRLKDRFWTEIYDGAKLFYLSGMVGGEYQHTEIRNLCRFISVMKFRPLTWRGTHPYILADRMEDITPPEKIEQDPMCNRRVTLYGYNRGMAMLNKQAIHIPGMGDFQIGDVENLPDPCPTPTMEKRRSLNQKERMIYAPMSGVGGILFDKDAVYIDVGGSHHLRKEEPAEHAPVIQQMMALLTKEKEQDESSEDEEPDDETEGAEMDDSNDELSDQESGDEESDGEDVNESMEELNAGEDSEESEEDMEHDEEDMEHDGEERDSDTDDEEEFLRKMKNHEEAEKEMKKRKAQRQNWQSLVYGDIVDVEEEEDEEDEEVGGIFRVLKKHMTADKEKRNIMDQVDSSKTSFTTLHNWDEEEERVLIKDCFVTGQWDVKDDFSARLQEDDELYGDFEDLETGEKHEADKEMVDDGEDDEDEKDGNEATQTTERKKTKAEMTPKERQEAKRNKKKEFDSRYDNRIKDDDEFYQVWKSEMEEQAKLNRAEFENMNPEMRFSVEGFRPGLYLRVEVAEVPYEFIKDFNPSSPIVIGGLSSVEQNVGYVQARFKKHRFDKRVLKTNDPLILSVGWRRFQTIPLYSKVDDNMRSRMLKYTPPHMHCMASFWGPLTPQGSGVLALWNVNDIVREFRVAGTGVVLELDKSVEVVKKLKLIGTPFKIMQKTAFIQGMFNSHLEVAKFEGAKIKTVSNVRGVIKKAVQKLAKTGESFPQGTFRATFEDRILMSDIVFLTSWYPVEIPQFYNPVTNLLGQWRAMKTVGQLRYERGIAVPQKKDSLYKPVERKVRRSAPLYIPKALQKELPFKITPKNVAPASSSAKTVAVINEPSETKRAKFLHKLKVVHEHKMRTKHAVMRERAHKHQKQLQKIAEKRERSLKDSRKEAFRVLGKLGKAKEAREKSRMKSSRS